MTTLLGRTFTSGLTVYNLSNFCIIPFMLNIPTTEERLGKSPQRLVRYFVLLMALVYLGLGAWLLWSAGQPASGALAQLGPMARRVLGAVFVFYGLLRFGRGYQQYFRNKSSLNDHD